MRHHNFFLHANLFRICANSLDPEDIWVCNSCHKTTNLRTKEGRFCEMFLSMTVYLDWTKMAQILPAAIMSWFEYIQFGLQGLQF